MKCIRFSQPKSVFIFHFWLVVTAAGVGKTERLPCYLSTHPSSKFYSSFTIQAKVAAVHLQTRKWELMRSTLGFEIGCIHIHQEQTSPSSTLHLNSPL